MISTHGMTGETSNQPGENEEITGVPKPVVCTCLNCTSIGDINAPIQSRRTHCSISTQSKLGRIAYITLRRYNLNCHRCVHTLFFSFLCSFLHSVLHSFLLSFFHSFLHSFLSSFIRAFVHSFLCSFLPSFLHSLFHMFLH